MLCRCGCYGGLVWQLALTQNVTGWEGSVVGKLEVGSRGSNAKTRDASEYELENGCEDELNGLKCSRLSKVMALG